MLYTVFLAEYWDGDKKQWKNSYRFYQGDLTRTDILKDRRFKEVPKKRKQIKLLGLKEIDEFPITFPLIINNIKYNML